MDLIPVHVLILIINPISIMVMFPILSVWWDRPLLAIPGATAAGLATMEVYYLLVGIPVAAPDILIRALVTAAAGTVLWALNAAVKRALVARREPDHPTAAA